MRESNPISFSISMLLICLIPISQIPLATFAKDPPVSKWFSYEQYFIESGDSKDKKLAFNKAFIQKEKKRLLGINKKNYKETFNLGLCQLFDGQCLEGVATIEKAVPLAQSNQETLLALLTAAEIWNGLGRGAKDESADQMFRRAGQLADKAQIAAPKGAETNRHIAKCRITYWDAAGDTLSKNVAVQHFKRLTPDADGKEVLEPGTIAVLAVAGGLMISAIASCTILIYVDKIEPEDAATLLEGVGKMIGASNILSLAL